MGNAGVSWARSGLAEKASVFWCVTIGVITRWRCYLRLATSAPSRWVTELQPMAIGEGSYRSEEIGGGYG